MLGEVPAQCIDQLGALPDEEIPRSGYHGAGLLPGSFGCDETRRRTSRRLGVGGIILLTFGKRFDVGQRDQPDVVTELAYLMCPIVGRRTRFHRKRTQWLARQK